MNKSSPLPTAALPRRLAAMVYDSFLLFGLLFLAGAIWMGVGLALEPTQTEPVLQTGETIHQLDTFGNGFFSLYLLAVIFSFFAYFWHRNGQTLGMQAWRLKLETLDAETVSYPVAAQRFVLAGLSLLLAGIGYWWILLDKQGYALHDRLSKTRVVLIPK